MNVKMLGAIGISGLLMVGGVVSASASSTSGYDLFKTSVKNMQTVNSFTADVKHLYPIMGKKFTKFHL